MNIQISNVRAIAHAELAVEGVTMIMGRNGSGKTTLLNTVAACLLGDLKMYGATQKNMSQVVRKGAQTASCRIVGDDWEKSMIWPDHLEESGQAPPCDEITLGRVDPAADHNKREWAAFVRKICGDDASLEWADVEAKLGTGEALVLGEVKQMLKTAGWDATSTWAKNKALDHRREWETVTGDRFGSDKAAKWGDPACEIGDSEDELRAELQDLREKLAKVNPLKCPHCETRLEFDDEGNLKELDLTMYVPWREVDFNIATARRDDLACRLLALGRTASARQCYDAWSWWSNVAEVTGPTGMRLEMTKRAIGAIKPKLDELAAIIFPEHDFALRADETGLGIYFDDQPYSSMVWKGDPNSYKLAVSVMFQILHADRLGGNAPILIDRADTLDKTRRNAILNLLVRTTRSAIIAQTVDAKPEVDMLAKSGVGGTYWLNNEGELEPI